MSRVCERTQAKRRPCPEPPALPVPTISSEPDEFEAFNNEARRIYSGELPVCRGCQRSFADETKLRQHQTSCSAFKEWLEARRRAKDDAEAAERRRLEESAEEARLEEERRRAEQLRLEQEERDRLEAQSRMTQAQIEEDERRRAEEAARRRQLEEERRQEAARKKAEVRLRSRRCGAVRCGALQPTCGGVTW